MYVYTHTGYMMTYRIIVQTAGNTAINFLHSRRHLFAKTVAAPYSLFQCAIQISFSASHHHHHRRQQQSNKENLIGNKLYTYVSYMYAACEIHTQTLGMKSY